MHMSEVASPLCASIVGQKAQKVAETNAPGVPHSRRDQKNTTSTMAAPKSEFMARAVKSRRAGSFWLWKKKSYPTSHTTEWLQPGVVRGGNVGPDNAVGRACQRWGRMPFSGCKR
jgi:hypothetical protein